MFSSKLSYIKESSFLPADFLCKPSLSVFRVGIPGVWKHRQPLLSSAHKVCAILRATPGRDRSLAVQRHVSTAWIYLSPPSSFSLLSDAAIPGLSTSHGCDRPLCGRKGNESLIKAIMSCSLASDLCHPYTGCTEGTCASSPALTWAWGDIWTTVTPSLWISPLWRMDVVTRVCGSPSIARLVSRGRSRSMFPFLVTSTLY